MFFEAHMDNRDDPEILAVAPLPSAEERRRRETSMDGLEIALSMLDGDDLSAQRRGELALVRLMVIAIEGIIYTDDHYLGVRTKTAKDLVREFKRVYPEASEV